MNSENGSALGRLVLVAVALGAMTASSDAFGTIPRVGSSLLIGPKAVWTNGTTTPMFHPLSDPIAAGQFPAFRLALEMDQDTGDCELDTVARYSNNGVDWDAPQAVGGGWLTSSGIQYDTAFVDQATLTNPRAYIQFGVEARNGSGANPIQMCNATLRVEMDGK
jgi:hypothetical protein